MTSSTTPEPVAREAARQHAPNPYTVTIVLIAMNVLVFLAMLASGVPLMDPSPTQVLAWGGDFAPLTVGAHQWWRLVTSCFVHYGLIHIGMNMYVLYQVGPFIEISFGRLRYVLIYAVAGLAGSLVSVWAHPVAVGAGASGAIFGLYGAVFSFLLFHRRTLAPQAVKSIGQSAGIFVIYNVAFGAMRPGTDMAAHLGGLVAGFLCGLALVRPRARDLR